MRSPPTKGVEGLPVGELVEEGVQGSQFRRVGRRSGRGRRPSGPGSPPKACQGMDYEHAAARG
jgi:hypothetical protein